MSKFDSHPVVFDFVSNVHRSHSNHHGCCLFRLENPGIGFHTIPEAVEQIFIGTRINSHNEASRDDIDSRLTLQKVLMVFPKTVFLIWVMILRAIINKLSQDPKRCNGDMELDALKDDENEGDYMNSQESKKRGPTMLHVVHTRKVDDREVIICNELGQPVGPVTNEKDIVGRFSRFLGTIACNHSYALLIHSSWHEVPHKDKTWEYVLKHCLQAKEISVSQKNMQTAGPKCFARIRDEMITYLSYTIELFINDDTNKKLPTLTKMFEHTCKRTEGHAYVYTYDDTERKIKDLWNHLMQSLMVKNMSWFKYEKNLDEEHERKRTELEAVQLDIKNQQEHLEATMRKLMEQLPYKNYSI
ncbi:hypothetical protein R6Q57_011183 [Mikania cordata]